MKTWLPLMFYYYVGGIFGALCRNPEKRLIWIKICVHTAAGILTLKKKTTNQQANKKQVIRNSLLLY